MTNEHNLVPMNQRSQSEARELGEKGGKASGAARRKRKSLRDSMNALLSLPISNTEDFNAAAQMGIPMEDLDNSQLIVLALFNKAKTGDVAALRELRGWIGEDRDRLDVAEQKQKVALLKAQAEKLRRESLLVGENDTKTIDVDLSALTDEELRRLAAYDATDATDEGEPGEPGKPGKEV